MTSVHGELSDIEKQILIHMLVEIEVMASIRGNVRRNRFLREYRERGVRYRPSRWLGNRLSVAKRQAFSRAVTRLETRGLLERDIEGSRNRVAFLRPTPTGLATAMNFPEADANLRDVTESLSQTTWGAALVHSLPKPEALAMPELMEIDWADVEA